MARRFGRRKPGVLWLPTFGHAGDPSVERVNGISTSLAIPPDGDIGWDAVALTFDYSDSAGVEQSLQERSLQDLAAGNEWRLRRIVGKLHAAWGPDPLTAPAVPRPQLVEYGAGFIVCKTDDDGNATTDFDEVNPLAQDSAEDPWIWRRKWMLRTIPGQLTYAEASELDTSLSFDDFDIFWAQHFPTSTAAYNSVADGPHIDQKTARVIHRQERLFFVQAAAFWSVQGSFDYGAQAGTMRSILDYRLLGSLRRSSAGNRRNASR